MDIPLPLEAEIQCTLYAARCDAFKLSGENPRVWNPRLQDVRVPGTVPVPYFETSKSASRRTPANARRAERQVLTS